MVTAHAGQLTSRLAQLFVLRAAQSVSPVAAGRSGHVLREGDRLRFEIRVVNNGTVTLRHLNAVDELLARQGSVPRCGAQSLQPGDGTTCVSSSYRVTRFQATHGAVTNFASVVAAAPSGRTVRSNSTRARVTVDKPADKPQNAGGSIATRKASPPRPTAKLALAQWVSAVADRNGNGVLDLGDTVTYSFEVSNVGDLRLHGLEVIDRALMAKKVGIRCSTRTLAPHATSVCVASALSITAYQAKNGLGRNFAHAVAQRPDGSALGSNLSVLSHGRSAVADPQPDTRALAFTGAETWPMLLTGTFLVLFGGLLAGAARLGVSERRRLKTPCRSATIDGAR
jgi:hypothetical protein